MSNAKKINLYPVLFIAALTAGCESLTETEESVTITLDSFNLIGSSNTSVLTRATITGNPGCSAGNTSLNTLLANVDNFDDIDEFLDSLDINAVRYRINNNSTSSDITASFQMTDPASSELADVASVNIPANTNIDEWTNLPFVDGGAGIAQHYMDNRDSEFLYCAEGTPNSSDISLTMDLQLDLTVTVDLL